MSARKILVFGMLVGYWFCSLTVKAQEYVPYNAISLEEKSAEQIEWEEAVYEKYKTWPAFRFVKEDSRLPCALLIGDSISIGYTLRVQNALKGKVNVHRIPVNGGNTLNGLSQLEKWLARNEAWDVIHFNFGLHDLKRQREGSPNPDRLDVMGEVVVPVEQYARNLEKLVLRLKQTGAQLIWAATTPIPDGAFGRVQGDELTYNAAAAEVMRKHDIRINDLYAYILPHLAKAQQPADVHFRDKGNERFAERICEELLSALDCKSDLASP